MHNSKKGKYILLEILVIIIFTSSCTEYILAPPKSYTLTTRMIGRGSVTKNPNEKHYQLNQIVKLTAIADQGWSFSSWSGDAAGSGNPLFVVIDGDKSITATFKRDAQTLTINIVGSGSVSRDNPGPYQLGDVVQLTAEADSGWSFLTWNGDLTGSTNPKSIIIDEPKTVTAIFTQNDYTLTVTVNPTGGGTVTKTPNQNTYHYGDRVTLSQANNPEYTFLAWSGDGVDSGAYRLVTITGNMFVKASYTTTGGGGGGGGGGDGGGGGGSGGSVLAQIILGSRDQKGNNNNLGEIWFNHQFHDLPSTLFILNGSYTLSYNPESDYLFDHWETLGDVAVTNSQLNSTNLIARGNGTITAVFTPKLFEVMLVSREENGTSSNLGSYILNGTTINTGDSLNREHGNYTVTFEPSSNYVFYRWETSEGVVIKNTLENTTSFSITGDGVLIAVYLLPKGNMKIVVEDTDGNKVPNATVSATQSSKHGPQLVGFTDSEGLVIFSDMVIDQYNVKVLKEGFVGKTFTVSPKMNLLVAETLALVKKNFTLTIRVLDQSGYPLAGTNVTLISGSTGLQPLIQSTDSSGLTTFEGVYIRRYKVLAASEGFSPQSMELVVKNTNDNMYTLSLTSLPNVNETAFQLLSFIGAAIVIAFIIFILAWNYRYAHASVSI